MVLTSVSCSAHDSSSQGRHIGQPRAVLPTTREEMSRLSLDVRPILHAVAVLCCRMKFKPCSQTPFHHSWWCGYGYQTNCSQLAKPSSLPVRFAYCKNWWRRRPGKPSTTMKTTEGVPVAETTMKTTEGVPVAEDLPEEVSSTRKRQRSKHAPRWN